VRISCTKFLADEINDVGTILCDLESESICVSSRNAPGERYRNGVGESFIVAAVCEDVF